MKTGGDFELMAPAFVFLLVLLCFSDLANYVPKHAMDFSTWQEHKHNTSISTTEDAGGQQTELTQEVMVSSK